MKLLRLNGNMATLLSRAAVLSACMTLLFSAAPARSAAADSRVLTTAKKIRELSSQQLSLSLPVHLRGVVTYWDSAGPNLFVQDSTAGIWVDLRGLSSAPPIPGDLIDLEGTAGSGFAPYVAQPRWRVLNRSHMPKPRAVSYQSAVDGSEDGQWVQMEGIVRNFVKEEGDVLVIDVGVAGGSFKVRVPEFRGPVPVHLVDSSVRFRGVCGTAFNHQRQLVAIHLFVPSLDYIQVIEPAPPEPFAMATVPIASLGRFSATRIRLHRTKVRGVITAQFPGVGLFIHDGKAGLNVETQDALNTHPGDEVEAVGFAGDGEYTPVLRSATIRRTGRRQEVPAVPITAAEASDGAYDAQLVQIEGSVQADNIDASGTPSLIMEANNIDFEALPWQNRPGTVWPAVPRGSKLHLTGICSVEIDANGNPSRFRIILRGPGDITILSRPPWLTSGRLLALLGLLAAGHLLGILWVWILRRRVRQQTAIIRQQLEMDAHRDQQMAQMQKMEAIGRLAGGVAHDFNNLLTIIMSYTALLTSSFPKDSAEQRRLQAIEEAAHKAAALTYQLLAYSRKQLLEPKAIEIDSLIRNLETMLRRLIRENVELSTNLRCGSAVVLVDPIQMEQVLINMAVNARDAMPSGGSLRIGTECIQAERGKTSLPVPPGHYVLISVEDTGVGMDLDTQERAFEPFFTTKDSGKGTGLGLAMVDGFVKQSGGCVTVRSSPGTGSTFNIYLPVAAGAADRIALPVSSATGRGRGTILLVEDEEAVRRLLADILFGLGYEVVQAGNGQEALSVLGGSRGRFDLVITDLIMPKMGGAEFYRELRRIVPNLHLLFISGHTDAVPGVDAANLLRKPFKPEELGRKVAEILTASRRSVTTTSKMDIRTPVLP